MHPDRNLLFGVFAVQLKKVTPSQIMAAAGAWATDQSKDLPERLVDEGALSGRDRDLILGLVEHAVADHGGDEGAALESFGGSAQVDLSFCGSVSKTADGVTVIRSLPSLSGETDLSGRSTAAEMRGRYQTLGEHGRGGMGRVLLVHDEVLGRDIALKELLTGTTSDGNTVAMGESPVNPSPTYSSRFLQEARVTGQLEHPSIVPVYELGHRDDGTLYYTMKLVRGKTFAEAIREHGTLEERLKLLPNFVALCQAIAYAHSRNVVHRDIKPQNVMVGEFGETVVLDWGLAKVKGVEDAHAEDLQETMRAMNLNDEDTTTKTKYGELLGTPVFAPPEQLMGEIDSINERSDIYSLGALLYVLLTGHPPFSKVPLSTIIKELPRPVSDFAPEVPKELVAICDRAMAKRPEDRFASAKVLAEDIQRFQSGALVQTYAYRPVELMRWFLRRNRNVVSVAAVAAILFISLVAWSYASLFQKNSLISQKNEMLTIKNQQVLDEQEGRITEALAAERARTQASSEKESRIRADRRSYFASMESVRGYIEDGRLDIANEVLMNQQTDARSWEWGRLLHQSNSHLAALRDVPDQCGAIAFSPDASRLAFGDVSGTLRIWNVNSLELEIVVPAHTEGRVRTITEIDFSPTGDRIATSSHDRSVRIWRVGESTPARILDHREYVSGVTFHPDGNQLASGVNDGTIRIWNLQNEDPPQELEAHQDAVMDVAYSHDGALLASASNDGTVRLWNSESLDGLGVRHQHAGTVFDVEISPDDQYLASAGRDGNVIISRLQSGLPPQELNHPRRVSALAFRPDSQQLMVACDDLFVRTYNCQTGQLLSKVAAFRRGVAFLAVSPDDRFLAVAAGDGAVRIWPSAGPNEFETLSSHIAPISAIATSNANGLVATAGSGTAIRLSGQDANVTTRWLVDHEGPVRSLEFRAAGSRLISASLDGTIRIWDTESGKSLKVLDTGLGLLDHASVTDDATHVAITTRDDVVSIWDLQDEERVQQIDGHALVRFLPKRSTFVTVTSDSGELCAWELGSDSPIQVIEKHAGVITSLTVEPSGTWVATGDDQGEALLWNAETFEVMGRFSAHWGPVQTLAFTADARRLLSIGIDGIGKLWDIESGELVVSIHTPQQGPVDARFGSNDRVLYVGSMTGEVYALNTIPSKAMDTAIIDGDEWAVAVDDWKAREFSMGQLGKVDLELERSLEPAADRPLRVRVSGDAFSEMLRKVSTAVKLYGVPWSAEGGLGVTDLRQFRFLRAFEIYPGDIVMSIGDLDLDPDDEDLAIKLKDLAKKRLDGLQIHVRRNGQILAFEYVEA